MRVLITGGFGFIGGRLGRFLSDSGYDVVLASRELKNPPVWLPNASIIKIDWVSDNSLKAACEGVDIVIHAAGMNAQHCTEDSVAALEFNGLVTARLLRASIEQKVKYFSYLSTAHVYKSPLVGVIDEANCTSNLHPYATSHLAGEYAVLTAIERKEIKGSVLRLSNAFGAPMHKNVNCWMLLVNDLCKQAVENKKIVLQTSGIQLRDFITMTDVCGAIEFQLNRMDSLSDAIINLGSGQSCSVMQMAKLVQQRCKAVLFFEPELVYPTSEAYEKEEELEYCNDVLLKQGFSFKNNDSLEIDDLLNKCNRWFKAK